LWKDDAKCAINFYSRHVVMSNLNLSKQMDACIYYVSFCNFQGNNKEFFMWSCVRVLALDMLLDGGREYTLRYKGSWLGFKDPAPSSH
jgi:hypothetical protein